MKSMKPMKLPLLLLLFTLAGEAAAKPPLPEAFYTSMSQDWVTLHACGASGKMSPETAALGVGYIRQMLTRYEVDQDRMSDLVKQAGDAEMDVITLRCNALAMKVLEVKQSQQQRAQAPAPQANHLPRNTVCNQVFGQTYCTTY
jgi:hypothetical protein